MYRRNFFYLFESSFDFLHMPLLQEASYSKGRVAGVLMIRPLKNKYSFLQFSWIVKICIYMYKHSRWYKIAKLIWSDTTTCIHSLFFFIYVTIILKKDLHYCIVIHLFHKLHLSKEIIYISRVTVQIWF